MAEPPTCRGQSVTLMVNALIKKIWGISNAILNASFISELIYRIHDSLQLGPSLGRDPHHVQDQHQRVQRQFLLWEIQFSQQSQHHLLCITSANFSCQSKYRWGNTFWLVWLLLEYSFVKWKSTKTNVSKMIWSTLIWKSIIQLCTGISLHLVVHKIESALKWQCVTLPDA